MTTALATLICAIGIAGLFYLDRDKSVRTSKALWLPVIYLWITGSRSVSEWLGYSPNTDANIQLNGSPLDAIIFAVLLAAATVVLILRWKRIRPFLIANWPILIYFVYCFISFAWSSNPEIAFKRWTKAQTDLAMCLVIVTDRQPVEALKRVVSRVGFILLPASLLLIKYYGNLGREYSPDGALMRTGVTTNKNMLGVMLFVVSLFTMWRVITLWRAKNQPDRVRHLLAQCALLAFGVVLLRMSDSKTSIACFALGSAIVFATGLRAIKNRPVRVHVLCLAVFLAGGLALLFGGGSLVVQAMGRKSNLSGRTDIWAALIPAAPNAIVGAGFESFWISPGEVKFKEALNRNGWWHAESLNEAHNGYLEVYLNLGILGVGLIVLILISGYRSAVAAYRRSPSIGGLMIAYIIVSAFYNITEAGFRSLDLSWIFLLLAIISASGVAMGVIEGQALRNRDSRGSGEKVKSASNKPLPIKATAWTV